MNISLDTIQFNDFVNHYVSKPIYDHIFNILSKNSSSDLIYALAAPSIGFIASAIMIIKMIPIFYETTIKGVINIIGSPFEETCQFKTGCKQLSTALVIKYFAPLILGGSLFYNMIYFALDPHEHLKSDDFFEQLNKFTLQFKTSEITTPGTI